jgi:hypothetical protein
MVRRFRKMIPRAYKIISLSKSAAQKSHEASVKSI